jgi:flagellar hook-associated protein 3 FlgL
MKSGHIMRVTFNTIYRNGLGDINRAASDLARSQREVASLRRVQVPSDDPAASSAIVGERTAMRTIDQYVRATNTVDSRLQVIDSVLSDLILTIESARVAAAAARSSTVTAPQREAYALQLEGLRDAVFTNMNSQVRGDFLFSGTRSDVAPYARIAGVVQPYAGDSQRVLLDIDGHRAVEISVDASGLMQGSEPVDLFESFAQLIAAVRNGDGAGIDTGLEALVRAHQRATDVQSRVGGALGALDSHRERLGALRRASDQRRASLEDANLAEAISRMQQADAAHRAALGAMSGMSRLSLLDFIR